MLAVACTLLLTGCLDGLMGDTAVSGRSRGAFENTATENLATNPGAGMAAAPFTQPIDDDPGRLLGLDPDALRALLGQPGFVRHDDPARMWRYRHADCVLDLFLYTEMAARQQSVPSFRVRHVEARTRDMATAPARGCLRALLVDRAATPAG